MGTRPQPFTPQQQGVAGKAWNIYYLALQRKSLWNPNICHSVSMDSGVQLKKANLYEKS